MGASTEWVLIFAFVVLGSFFFLFAAFWFGYLFVNREGSVSPYTGIPLRRASELPYYAKERIARFMTSFHQYDNRLHSFNRAAFCRETGRIFFNCVTWVDTVNLGWDFLQKRYPGQYVSWGSLNDLQKEAIRKAHESLENFQTVYSCPHPAPRAIDSEYILTKPGPLYVDLQTRVLLGWQIVPGTELEVLIVQQPKDYSAQL